LRFSTYGVAMAVSRPAPDPSLRPRLRGRSHQWAFFVALAAGAALVVVAPDGRARLALAVYAVSVSGLLGVSALYHRIPWRTWAARRRMRRVDHAMIFLLIAGTYTPFALLVFTEPLATIVLIVVWSGAALGALVKIVWIDAPRALITAIYVALGWVSAITLPQLLAHGGGLATALAGAGGVLYTIGAIVYARRRPDPVPTVFGYHEVFHALVVIAAAAQFAAVAIVAL